MLGLQKVVSIKPIFSADDWQLYTASMKCDDAAKELNRQLRSAVNGGLSKNAVRKDMLTVMSRLSKYGAYDSEPLHFLEDVLDEIYGME